jgi:hypothetical protein
LRDSVLAILENVHGTTAKDITDMVLVTWYFDTMEEIGDSSKSSSVFIPMVLEPSRMSPSRSEMVSYRTILFKRTWKRMLSVFQEF